jgi:hypothetical protein
MKVDSCFFLDLQPFRADFKAQGESSRKKNNDLLKNKNIKIPTAFSFLNVTSKALIYPDPKTQ